MQNLYQFQKEWSEAVLKGDKEAEKEANKKLPLLDTFTKSDWEELISRSYGRAKYEYTKRMKELFPE